MLVRLIPFRYNRGVNFQRCMALFYCLFTSCKVGGYEFSLVDVRRFLFRRIGIISRVVFIVTASLFPRRTVQKENRAIKQGAKDDKRRVFYVEKVGEIRGNMN